MVNCLLQNCSISGMNGSDPRHPFSSKVAKISSALRTSTVSPTRSLSACLTPGLLSFTLLTSSSEPAESYSKCGVLLTRVLHTITLTSEGLRRRNGGFRAEDPYPQSQGCAASPAFLRASVTAGAVHRAIAWFDSPV